MAEQAGIKSVETDMLDLSVDLKEGSDGDEAELDMKEEEGACFWVSQETLWGLGFGLWARFP